MDPELDPSSGADFIQANRRAAVTQAVTSLDSDPEAAARSMELSQATGVPAPVINGNLEGFEQQHKASLTTQLLNNNDYLRSYINANPMAAKVSNDDYAQLDAVSASVSKMQMGFGSRMAETAKNSFFAMFKPPEGSDLAESISPEDLKNHPIASAVYAGLGTPINMLLQGMQEDVHGLSEGARKIGEYVPAIGPEKYAGKNVNLGQDIAGLVEAEAMGMTGRHGGPELPHDPLARARTYIENGREPLPTILPEYDDFRAKQNAADIDALKEATSEAQQSLTRNRSPELFRQFIAQHTDAEIGISGDAVAALYGDKVPDPTDNLLGWMPNIADKLELAKSTGADVSVPLADWLTHAEPETMQALHDDLRVRPGGITATEVKAASEQKSERPADSQGEIEPLSEDVPSYRAATALEPLFSVGDRKLELQRMDVFSAKAKRLAAESGFDDWEGIDSQWREDFLRRAQEQERYGPAQGFHDFHIMDQNGNKVGALNISEQKGGKELYVDGITGVNGLGPRDFGPALMRDVLRQIKAEFPNAESIGGHRVSGAREAAGKEMSMPEAKVKLDVLDEAGFQKLLEGGQWETYSPNIQAYIKPDAMRSEADRQLVQIVNEEADQIAPKKTAVQVVDTIKAKTSGIEGQRADENIKVGGAYIRYKETYPIILAALDSKDTLGTFRHEVVHHLRQYGFFKPEEWETLQNEALAGGWFSKYRIDARYPTAGPELKLEEAIADAYPEWKARQEALKQRADQTALPLSPLDDIFQKMKDFFNGIKAKVDALFGKDATWEDVFKRVDTGEVGGREGTEPLDARAFNEKLSLDETPERIRSAAIKYKDEIHMGQIHGDAVDKLLEKHPEFNEDGKFPHQDFSEGYVTSNGRFVSREEAADIARNSNQLKPMIGKSGMRTYIPEIKSHDDIKTLMAEDLLPSSLRQVEEDLKTKLSVEEQLEGGSRVFERASALGMTVDQFKAYDRLMQKRYEEDVAAATKRSEDFQRKTQTKEWKDNRRELRVDISKEIHQRPDVAADLFFATGELYGQKISSGYKLDSDQLSPEQRAAIPKDYQARGGLNPDDVANIFGYGSGDAMLARLAEYNAAKKASGLGAKDFVARVTDAEADRQMRLRHGVLEDNIVDSVKEQVASETQLDILHEETHKLGMEIGQAPLDKTAILTGLRDSFNKMQIGSVSSDAYMRAAGKSGRAAELALLKNDPQEAFRAKQQQYYATVIANLAIKTEKALGQFDKIAKRFSQRTITTVDQEYTNFIHDILMRVGKPVRRSVQDLEAEIQAGEYKTLGEFVAGKETHGLREVPVADILLDPSFRKKFEDLTVDEFNATNDSIKTLVKNGRDEKKINKAGEAFDLNEVKQQLIDQIASITLKPKIYDAKGMRADGILPKALGATVRSFVVQHLQLEGLFNRFDEGNPNGPFQQFITRDLVDAASNEGVLRKKYADMMKAVDDKADLRKGVDNTIFKDPNSGQLMKFDRENLRAVLLNMGNESNMSKLARGYKIEPTALWDWVGKHATKEDWDWAQKVGDVFKGIKAEADAMYRNLSGVAPASLDIKSVQTLHGEYPGWYYPVINHPEFEGKSKKLMGPNALEGEGFVRATTPSGYTKGRTGYAGPMALDLDMLPGRMSQMLHDIALRPAVINASKMFYDDDFRTAISKYYNSEARDMLIPYLKSVANSSNYVPKSQKWLVNAGEFIRQNMISTLVGLNPGTVLKHGPTAAVQSLQEVGAMHFLKAIKGLFSVNEATGESNWQFAMKTFDELQLRHRNYEQTLTGTVEQMAPKSGFMSLRQTIQKFSATPVAISDLLSAVPMALAQYSKSMEEGATHGDAVYMANRAVRRAHGSMAITNRAEIMRGGALSQYFVSVYGFFNHIMNRQYELAWKAGDTLGLVKDGNYAEAMQQVPELTSKLFAYVIAPTIIEEMVTPLASSDNESWGKKAVKGLAFTLGASWVGVRDLVSGMTGGRDPSVGLITTTYKTMSDFVRDAGKDHPLSKEHAGRIVRDAGTLLGAGTGMVPEQVSKAAQFAQGVHAGTERPKGPWGWMVGARFGTLKNHAGTFQEWQRHH